MNGLILSVLFHCPSSTYDNVWDAVYEKNATDYDSLVACIENLITKEFIKDVHNRLSLTDKGENYFMDAVSEMEI